MANPPYIWFNGEIIPWEQATVHITDARSLLSVTAVYEGIRGYWNADEGQLYIMKLHDHLRRLADSTKVMRMTPRYSPDELAQIALDLVRRNDHREDIYIRPVVTFAPMVDSW